MSSHHVVRENQEPALLIWDLDAVTIDVLHQLLEWSPVVAVHAAILDSFLLLGIKADVVFCETEAITPVTEKVTMQQPVKVIGVTSLKLTDALFFLKKHGAYAVNIIKEADKHTWQEVEDISLDLKLVFYDGFKATFQVRETYSKWLSGNSSLLLETEKAVISTKGFMKDVVKEEVKDQITLTTERDGQAEVKIHEGRVWLSESID